MLTTLPLSREIVLIGGGHAHALLLRRWGMAPLPGARLTLINPSATAPYTGMLPGFVAGHYTRDALEIDLVRLARFAGARMIFGMVTAIDRQEKHLTVAGRPPIAYDIASLDIGITSDMPDLPGFADHGIAAKPLGPFATRWQAHLNGGGGDVAVIGGGVAGVELALAMRHAMGTAHAVTIIEADTALRGVADATRTRLRAALKANEVALLENSRVTSVTAKAVTLSDSTTLPATLTVGAAGARPFPWLEDTGLVLENGFVTVDENLRSVTDPAIFAVGDCAHLSQSPRPKAGVFAVRAAPVLTTNLKAAASGKPLKPFRPQTHYLKLISLGNKSALADKWGHAIGGAWAWRWKDHIDQAFMTRLNTLPQMQDAKLPQDRAEGATEGTGAKPLCGGCGAKLGAGVLDGVLSSLPQTERSDIVTGHGDDAAIIAFGDAQQMLTTDHLRAFWEDPWLMGRITALHALGDIWAMGARPQAVLPNIILPRMAEAMQRNWLAEIMAAASEVFTAEGASIVGGHTTMGAELSLGITITGLADTPLTLGGAQAGNVLLLTRPIGSGALLAGEMAGRARGDDIETMLTTLARSQGDAAAMIAPHAKAMTDVTGFGLAGHAARMADASSLSARINLSAVPVFSGALDLTKEGIRSTVWQANRDFVACDVPDDPIAHLLFDPQTAGGLLAAVPEEQVDRLLSEVRDLGHNASIIGQMTAPTDQRVVIA